MCDRLLTGRRRLSCRPLVILLAVLVLAPAVAEARTSDAPVCREVELAGDGVPGWTVSGAWPSPGRLVLVDALTNRLLQYDARGRYLGDRAPALAGDRVGPMLPTAIAKGGASELFLELTGGRLVQIHGSDRVAHSVSLIGRELATGHSVGSLFNWTVAGDRLVAFGNLKAGDDDWSTGFYAVELDPGQGGRVLEELPRYSAERLWYRLGFHYSTSIGRDAYFLRFGDQLRIARYSPDADGPVFLDALPDEIRTAPDLPAFETVDEFVGLMDAVEAATMPVGLYGWKGDLYVLWRQAGQTGQNWALSRIDPERDELVGTIQVPSDAHHLVAVPGPAHWAFVEKGRVEGFGVQKVESLQLVPASRIRAIGSGGPLCPR